MHTGIDIKAAHGESVGASMDGVVTYAGVRGAYGNLVVVDHGDGVSTWYAHLSAVAVSAGQAVTAGQLLGFVGSTGRSTGPHLHFEARANGYPFNPMHRVSFERGALHIEGMRVRDAEPQIHEALPAAPGGTVIRVDWSGDVMKSDGGTMAVEWD
jgi:murein DD-endopeptidase MepM/ murein hydrolase activator NlpD